MSTDEFQAILDRHAAELLEHCDTVQILATVQEDGQTTGFDAGGGNWFARKGQASEWLERDSARTMEHVRVTEFCDAPGDDPGFTEC